MPKPHTIRLRGPWKYRVLTEDTIQADGSVSRQEVAGLTGKTQISADWTQVLGATFRGKVRLTRHFHEPTGLDPSSRVDLAIDSVDGLGIANLNGELLGNLGESPMPARFDITARLRPRNELVIDVVRTEVSGNHLGGDLQTSRRQSPLTGGLVGEVRLEIR